MSINKKYPLVLIEWEDSAQPIPSWMYLSDFKIQEAVKCNSVGWLIRDEIKVKVLAPNIGEPDSDAEIQASGIFRIPTRCIIKIKKLD